MPGSCHLLLRSARSGGHDQHILPAGTVTVPVQQGPFQPAPQTSSAAGQPLLRLPCLRPLPIDNERPQVRLLVLCEPHLARASTSSLPTSWPAHSARGG
eukprot:4528277-Pyramimonas_sp.AAC.1